MKVNRGPGPVFILVNTIMLWLSTAIAATALWPIYRSGSVVVVVVVALVVGTLVAVPGAVRRWPSSVIMLATIALFLAVGVPVAVPAKAQFGFLPTLDGLRDLVLGVALGWKQLVTISLPVGQYQALLVPALVLVLLTTVVGLSIALRARRGELAALAPVILFVASTALGPNYPSRPLDAPLALLIAVLFWLVWFRWYRRRSAIRLLIAQSATGSDAATATTSKDFGFAGLRTVLSAGVILALAAGAAVAAAGTLPPTGDRVVVRTATVQPFDPRNFVSPLAGFRSYFQSASVGSVLFEVTGLPAGGRIRLATLDTYDGVVYSVGTGAATSSGSFTRVPAQIDQSAIEGERVGVGVTIRGYSGVWVPTVGGLESITFSGSRAGALRDGFYYNALSGAAAVVSGLAPGDAYQFQAVVPRQPDQNGIAALAPGSASVPAPKGVPKEVAAKLDEYVRGVDGPGPRLAAMLAGLAADGYISHGVGANEPPSRSGHAADRIAQLLTAPRMIGDAEQYAVTAALMAQDLGFPARVVFGFVPATGQVRGGDVSAWIEVSTAQFGWVTIDPTPPPRKIPDAVPVDRSQVARPPSIVTPPLLPPETLDRQAAPGSQQQLAPDLNPVLQVVLTVLRIGGQVLLVLAIVLAPFLVVIAAKIRRRRLRRRAPSTIRRITGGWQEFADAVLDHGLSPVPSSTRSEVAAITGGVQSQQLAEVADRAVFSPGEPDPSEADTVWRAVDTLRSSLDRGLTRWQRIRARVSLRSLGGYSVRALFTRSDRRALS